jgi:hypothetical protein
LRDLFTEFDFVPHMLDEPCAQQRRSGQAERGERPLYFALVAYMPAVVMLVQSAARFTENGFTWATVASGQGR